MNDNENGFITCDECGNDFHKFLVSETEDGNFCERCNSERLEDLEEDL